MRGLKNKRIIVAGGANGIGAATVERLVTEGARVFVGDLDAAALERSRSRFRSSGHEIDGHRFDMAEESSIEDLVARAIDRLGGLDAVVVTVADLSKATMGNDHDVAHMQRQIWERTLQVNLIGHAVLIRTILPHLKAAGGGAIVVTSSAVAYVETNEMPAYAASKSGLHALVRHTAKLAGPDRIRCNGVAPGLVLTDGAKVNLTETQREDVVRSLTLPRLGEPADIASAFTFLISEDSSWITGQILAVNGGYRFRD